jgi:purine-binding chemotaxis protein CheW
MIEEFRDQKEVQMIIFRLGSEEYAVPIMSVQEIIMKQAPTHLPKSASWVEGVINLRGRVIPIIDGKKKFSLDSRANNNDDDSRIMVLDVEHEIIGLIVDEVSEVIYLKTDEIEPPPVDVGEDNDFLWGVGKFQNRLLILINPQKFLTNAEVHDLKKLAKVAEAIGQAKEAAESKDEPVKSAEKAKV